MSVNSTTNKVTYTGDGATDIFPYAFKIYDDTDLIVERKLIADGTIIAGTLNTHYTVSGAGDSAGGNVTTIGDWENTAATYKIVIRRVLPLTQLIDLADNESTSADTLEEAYDRLCMVAQSLQEQINRSLLQSSDVSSSIDFPSASDGTYLGWVGSSLSNRTLSDIGIVAKATDAEAAGGVVDTSYMTPKKTSVAIAALAAAGLTKASTAEAQAGTDDTKYMTPAKTSSAIASQAAQKGANTDITSLTGLTGDIYNVVWTDYSAISTIVGWTSFTTKQIYYKKVGKLIFCAFYLSGTSDSATTTFTLPSNATQYFGGAIAQAKDNGSTLTTAVRIFGGGGGNAFAAYKDFSSASWTTSGTKEIIGSFWYEIE